MSLLLRRRNTCERFQQTSMNAKVKEGELRAESLNSLLETQTPVLNSGSTISFDSVVDEEESIDFTNRPLRREVYIRKLANFGFGAELISINDSIYVACVCRRSAAYRAGLKFGDQIIALADKDVLTFNGVEDIMRSMKKESRFTVNVVDFPLKKTFSMSRTSSFSPWGFSIKGNAIIKVDKDSPAFLAGVPVGFGVIEVNGVNVLLSTDKQINNLINKGSKQERKSAQISVMELPAMHEFYAYLSSVIAARASESNMKMSHSSSTMTLSSLSSKSENNQNDLLELSNSLNNLNSVL